MSEAAYASELNELVADAPTQAATLALDQTMVDEVAGMVFLKWSEIYSLDRAEVEKFQLSALRKRFDELMPEVSMLAAQAQASGATSIGQLSDVVPLLFQHTVYKSYPASLVEKGRFDLMTQWLGGLTSRDLSAVDVSRCEGVDDWFGALETQAGLVPFHTTGTTGKLSIIPRSVIDAALFYKCWVKRLEGYGGVADFYLGGNGTRLPVVFTTPRYGRYTAQRVIQFLTHNVAPSPDRCYTLTNGALSADLVVLSGRIRMAQAKGTLSEIKLSDSLRAAFNGYLAEIENRDVQLASFMDSMFAKLGGERIYLQGQSGALVQAAQAAKERGVGGTFASDSLLLTGGGGKGLTLPVDWREQISEFTGIKNIHFGFGMTEICTQFTKCTAGFFHIPAYVIPFLLDPRTGAMLPRTGTQTGRFAAVDLLPNDYWGGIVSGDKMTIEWDRQCACGRKGTHFHDSVTRYGEDVTGDDKITCAATVDQTDAALQQLLEI